MKIIDLFIYMPNLNQVKKPGIKPKSLVGEPRLQFQLSQTLSNSSDPSEQFFLPSQTKDFGTHPYPSWQVNPPFHQVLLQRAS